MVRRTAASHSASVGAALLFASLATLVSACCDGVDTHEIRFGCEGECVAAGEVTLSMTIDGKQYTCTEEQCDSKYASSRWDFGLPGRMAVESDSRAAFVDVELVEGDEVIFSDTIEMEAEAQYCGCNENAPHDQDCDDARFSHMLNRGAVFYAYPIP